MDKIIAKNPILNHCIFGYVYEIFKKTKFIVILLPVSCPKCMRGFLNPWNKYTAVMSVYSEGESQRTLTTESRTGEIPYSQRHDASAER